MKVKDIMTAEPRTCTSQTTVAAAAREMWDGDCGILPVVDGGQLVGVVTDRDMYIALATRDRRPSELQVGDVACKVVVTATPEEDVHAALERMKRALVRRLPVLGFNGSVVGVISIDDVLRAAGPRKPIRSDEVVSTLQAICGHHQQVSPIVAA